MDSAADQPDNADDLAAFDAVAALYHAFFLGLILSVVTRRGEADAARFVHAVFRHQHREKFLPGIEKLGLTARAPAAACAAYHVLSNAIGGVRVEYVEDGPRAWVVFPAPRWIWAGPAACAVPSAVSRGMLTGWYAHNGISLGVPDLRFVNTHQLVDGDFGLAGYFEQTGRPLGDHERLAFVRGVRPPRADPAAQPTPPEPWAAARLARARRNYAMEYVRSALPRLAELFGTADANHLARTTGRLVGAQEHRGVTAALGASGTSPASFAALVERLTALEGDGVDVEDGPTLVRGDFRLTKGLASRPDSLFEGWFGLLEGLAMGHDRDLTLTVTERLDRGDPAWRIRVRQLRDGPSGGERST